MHEMFLLLRFFFFQIFSCVTRNQTHELKLEICRLCTFPNAPLLGELMYSETQL